jgi:NADH dehydrogenase [ubiquinone] 1 alpha subcomplex assembly factor 6
LNEKPFISIESLESYAENTVSSINYLLVECLQIRDVRVDHAASHIGKAQGLVTTIRAIPYLAQRRRVLLPLDILMKHQASAEVSSMKTRGSPNP